VGLLKPNGFDFCSGGLIFWFFLIGFAPVGLVFWFFPSLVLVFSLVFLMGLAGRGTDTVRREREREAEKKTHGATDHGSGHDPRPPSLAHLIWRRQSYFPMLG
jgi:hypothetical protein